MRLLLLLTIHYFINHHDAIQCNGNCTCTEDRQCLLNCTGINACTGNGVQLSCKRGYPCTIICSGELSCGGVEILGNNACGTALICGNGFELGACHDTQLICGAQKCLVRCHYNNCDGLHINCNASNEYECVGDCPPPYATEQCRSMYPTYFTTLNPTNDPTQEPTQFTTVNPTNDPTQEPTQFTTVNPTNDPTQEPTENPIPSPTGNPTTEPTSDPTLSPTYHPTTYPTNDPTQAPTKNPTPSQTDNPTLYPTKNPTFNPTYNPTYAPTLKPTFNPTAYPTFKPTIYPTFNPTVYPTFNPTIYPTFNQTEYPTFNPTNVPTDDPLTNPTESPVVKSTMNTTVSSTADSKTSIKSGIEIWGIDLWWWIGGILIILILCIFIVCGIFVYLKSKNNNDDQKNVSFMIEGTEMAKAKSYSKLEDKEDNDEKEMEIDAVNNINHSIGNNTMMGVIDFVNHPSIFENENKNKSISNHSQSNAVDVTTEKLSEAVIINDVDFINKMIDDQEQSKSLHLSDIEDSDKT